MTAKLAPETQRRLRALGRHLRTVRRARGLSQRKLADAIGMQVANYARIERGAKNVTYDTLLRVANGLGVRLTVEFVRQSHRQTPRARLRAR